MKNKSNILLVLICFLCSSISIIAQNRNRVISDNEENTLRIMSYNVRGMNQAAGDINYKRVLDAIEKLAPDIIAVQEAGMVSELSSELLMHWIPSSSVGGNNAKDYNLGIFSKEKPLLTRIIPLPGKDKALFIAEFDKFVMCCTQLSADEKDRVSSIAIIMDAVKDYKKPLYLAGDMNSSFDSLSQNTMKMKFSVLSDYSVSTIPVINAPNIPSSCIDFIYGYNNGNLYSVLKKGVTPIRGADHYPIYADVRVAATTDEIFRTKPYLQRPVDGDITISWLTNVPTHSWVEYGKNGKLDRKKEVVIHGQILSNNMLHHFRLENLEEGETYSYRICSREITLYASYKKEFGNTAVSDVYSYTVPETDETDFTALLFNDIHDNYELMHLFKDLIQRDKIEYDFVIFNGDCINDPKDEKHSVKVVSELNDLAYASQKPVFHLRGNHEIRNSYSIGVHSLFDYIEDVPYGAFSWGDTRFVLLDCGEDKPDSVWVYYGLNDFNQFRIDQREFLKEEMDTKMFKSASKRVLVHHIPIYGESAAEYNPCYQAWGDVLLNAPFDVALNGHTHRYAYHPEESEKNNFPVVVGGGKLPKDGTMFVLEKKGKQMTLRVLDVKGEEILKLAL